MHADATRVGAAFVAKRSPANPRQILVDMIEANPGASKDFVFDKWHNLIDEDMDLMRAVAWYFFVNFYEYETTSRNRKPLAASARAVLAAEQRRIVDSVKQQIALLNWVLPSGKRLADSTFGEIAKLGGWLAKVAKKGKPNQIVGKVLTEKQLRAIK